MRIGPLLFAAARTAFLLLAQSAFAAFFYLRNDPHPWNRSTAWWTVYGTLVDLGCLTCLFFLTRAEGATLRSLLQGGLHLRRNLLRGLAYFALIMPLFAAGFLMASLVVYHSLRPGVDGALLGSRQLPLWARIYSVSIWWIIWSVTEELTYQTYLLDRLRRTLPGGLWPAVAIVAFWWAIQHSALPFLPDFRWVLWRFLGFLPGVLALIFAYRRTGRIAPVIIGHWPMDILASALTIGW